MLKRLDNVSKIYLTPDRVILGGFCVVIFGKCFVE
jgi:hypothetical protein